jgi:anthranilate synthase component 2
VLGVCLGHQAICYAYGSEITYAKNLMHGKQSVVTVTDRDPMFEGLPDSFPVARYHSLVADPDRLSGDLVVTSVTKDGEIMSVRHRTDRVYGLQFHPESILTPDGKAMLDNFINRIVKGGGSE